MQFSEPERRFLHAEHPELRMGELRTVEQFAAIGCPPAFAERIVQRELEKRVRQLSPALAAVRQEAGDPLIDRINAASF